MSTASRRLVAAVFLLALIFVGMYALRWQSTIDDLMQPSLGAGTEETTVRLYFADSDASCLLVETREVTFVRGEGGAPSAEQFDTTAAQAALAALAAGPESSDLWPVIPQDARVLRLSFDDGIATVDYSEELRTNHGGGSAGEILTVSAIAGTLSEFPGVEAVAILLEGAPMETLAGHLSLVDPVRVDPEALARGKICWDGIH